MLCRLTFWAFDQLDIQDSLSEAPPASDAQADETSCILQRLHGPAVRHLPDVGLVHSHYAVVHPAGRSQAGNMSFELHVEMNDGEMQMLLSFTLKLEHGIEM